MSKIQGLRRELQTLTRQWERLTAVPETPRSLMDVIEYSLGTQRKAEVYTNRLFADLLDPEQPHRMHAEFLRAFLTGLPDTCGFEEDLHDLSDIVPGTQPHEFVAVDYKTDRPGTTDADTFVAEPAVHHKS